MYFCRIRFDSIPNKIFLMKNQFSMKKLTTLLAFAMLFTFNLANAQTVEELQAQKDAKAAELAELSGQLAELQGRVDGLTGEVASLTDQLTPYPRWDVGAGGTVGLSFTGFSDWLSKANPNTQATSITFSGGGSANGEWEKTFWRNNLNLTAGWLKFDDKDIETDADTFQVAADAFNIASLFGYKLSDKIAISTLGEYRSTIVDNFNNPGYLDIGVGATWTPVTNLVVVVHPLNYNFVFSDSDFDYQSSLGAKIVADYKREIFKGFGWKSNLSAFYSYEGSDLHNWTWINGISTAYKGIGIGFELGLRNNKQEALAAEVSNTLQTYYVLGLTYSL